MNFPRMTSVLFGAALIAAPSLAYAQHKLIVAMPTTPPNIVHMPMHIANDLGLFKKYGLEIKVIELAGGVYTFRAVVAGSADVASASGPFSIVGRAKGAATKMILANMPKLEASMVVNKDIKTMADLKGKRIGIQEPGGFADVLARGVLRAAKIDPKEVNFVSIATEDVPALVAGQIDTAILHVEQEIIAQQKIPSLHAIARLWEIQPENLYNVHGRDGEADQGKARGGQGVRQGSHRGDPADLHRPRQGAADHRQVHQAAEGRRREVARFHGAEVHLGRQSRPQPRSG